MGSYRTGGLKSAQGGSRQHHYHYCHVGLEWSWSQWLHGIEEEGGMVSHEIYVVVSLDIDEGLEWVVAWLAPMQTMTSV